MNVRNGSLPGGSGRYSQRTLSMQYARFVVLSGSAWLLALALLWAGVHVAHLPVWLANAIGDGVAIIVVSLVSPLSVFGIHDSRKGRTLLVWMLWQMVHIAAISWTIDAATHAAQPLWSAPEQWLEVVMKIAVTPITVTLNFLVARFLMRGRRSAA